MIPKETKYNLHYGEVRGDILRPPHGTITSCSVIKWTSKKISFGNKEHRLENGNLGFTETLHKQYWSIWWNKFDSKNLLKHSNILQIQDILYMCTKMFGIVNIVFDKNLAMYVYPYVCLSSLLFPITYNLKQIYILIHCFSVPRRQSLPAGGGGGCI